MGKRRKKVEKDDVKKLPKLKDPDPNADDFMYDEVDEFHKQRDKILLDPEQDEDSDLQEDSEEEVLQLESDDDDDDEDEEDDGMEEAAEASSDEDDDDATKDLPSDKAWGRSKKVFYDADVEDEDIYASDEEGKLAVEEEEKEAMSLQKRALERLDETDFNVFDIDFEVKKDSEKSEVSSGVVKDLSKLSKRERLEILVKDSPELLGLMEESKKKLKEVEERYHPLLTMSRNGLIPSEEGRSFIETKHTVLLSYCVNVGFYLMLKASKEATKNHPVVERIMQLTEVLEKLDAVDAGLQKEIDHLLSQYKAGDGKMTKIRERVTSNGVDVSLRLKSDQKKKKKGKDSMFEDESDDEEDTVDPLEYYKTVKMKADQAKKAKKEKKDVLEDAEENELVDEDGKRKITYEMEKNKGLTRKRRKELRNPRVKHKMKFKKAKVKHKGQVREVMTEMQRYGGERTGITANLARSVKLKS